MSPRDVNTSCASLISANSNSTSVEDVVYSIGSAQVVLVDYKGLFNDFEELRPATLIQANPRLQALPENLRTQVIHRAVYKWLLMNAGVVSDAQTRENNVNTPIAAYGSPRKVRRPPRYARACIVKTQAVRVEVEGLSDPILIEGAGELDIKGVGVQRDVTPVRGHYSDGLLPLVHAVQELIVERFIAMVLSHARNHLSTLTQYAVLATGFDAFDANSVRFPAGLIVRRAHTRDSRADLPHCDTPDQYAAFRIELLLRRYGITSAERCALEIREVAGQLVALQFGRKTEYPHNELRAMVDELHLQLPFEAEGINIQLDFIEEAKTFGRQLVDFGQYVARTTFERSLVSLVCDRPLGWGGMIMPTDPCFEQPDPRLTPNGLYWEESCQPGERLFRTFAEDVVSQYRLGVLNSDYAKSIIPCSLKNLTRHWPLNP